MTLFGPRFADYVKRRWPWTGRSVCYKRGDCVPCGGIWLSSQPAPTRLLLPGGEPGGGKDGVDDYGRMQSRSLRTAWGGSESCVHPSGPRYGLVMTACVRPNGRGVGVRGRGSSPGGGHGAAFLLPSPLSAWPAPALLIGYTTSNGCFDDLKAIKPMGAGGMMASPPALPEGRDWAGNLGV